MVTAIFGLLGVLVGAVVTGLTQHALDRARERRLKRASLRLLANELGDAWISAKRTRDEGTWVSPHRVNQAYSTDVWVEHRTTLAATVDSFTWLRLLTIHQTLGKLRAMAEAAQIKSEGTVMPEQRVELDYSVSLLEGVVKDLIDWDDPGRLAAFRYLRRRPRVPRVPPLQP
jgi:hypothetical protein